MRSFFLLIVLLGSSSLVAKPTNWKCPDDLNVNPKQSLLKTPKGWQTFSHPERYRFALEAVHFYSGHPKKLGQLRLEGYRKHSITWKRGKGDTDAYWMVCQYSDTNLNLTRKIPKRIKTCTVKYENGITINGLNAIKSVVCG